MNASILKNLMAVLFLLLLLPRETAALDLLPAYDLFQKEYYSRIVAKLQKNIADLEEKKKAYERSGVGVDPEGELRVLKRLQKRITDTETIRTLYEETRNAFESIRSMAREWQQNGYLLEGGFRPGEVFIEEFASLKNPFTSYDYYQKITALTAKLEAVDSAGYIPETRNLLKSLRTLSTIMSEFGPKYVPLIGSFLKGYGDLTNTFLDTIDLLRKRIIRDIDQGEIGTGSHAVARSKVAAWNEQNIGENLERVPGFSMIYRSAENGSRYFIWDANGRRPSGKKGRWVPVHGLDIQTLKHRYIQLFYHRGKEKKVIDVSKLIRRYGKLLKAVVETQPQVASPGEDVRIRVRLFRLKDGKEADKAEVIVTALSRRFQVREGTWFSLKAPGRSGRYPLSISLASPSSQVWVIEKVEHAHISVGRKAFLRLSLRPDSLICDGQQRSEILITLLDENDQPIRKGVVTLETHPRQGSFLPNDIFFLERSEHPIRAAFLCHPYDAGGVVEVRAAFTPYPGARPVGKSRAHKSLRLWRAVSPRIRLDVTHSSTVEIELRPRLVAPDGSEIVAARETPLITISGQGLMFRSAHRFSRKGLRCTSGETIRARSRDGRCGSFTLHLRSDGYRDEKRMTILRAADRVATIRLPCKKPPAESSEPSQKPNPPIIRGGGKSTGSQAAKTLWQLPDWRCQDPQTVKRLLDSYGINTRFHASKTVDPGCPAGTVISQSPAAGKRVESGQEVELTVNPTRRLKLAINLSPQAENDRYRVGTTIYMISRIIGKDLYPDAKEIWWIDGKEVAEGGAWVLHTKEAGSYRIMFELRSKNGKTIDTVTRTITVEESPKGSGCGECRIQTVQMKKKSYQPGETVELRSTGLNDSCPKSWYDNGRALESHGDSITLTLDGAPLHHIELQSGDTRCFINLRTQKKSISRPIGHHVNRFELVKTPEKNRGVLSVCFKELIYGRDPEKLPCTTVATYRHVPPYQYWLSTGDQSDGFNAGYLLYRSENDPLIHFAVLHRRFRTLTGNRMGTPYGVVAYQGTIPHTERVSVYKLYRETHANWLKLSWKGTNGKFCRAIIGKYRKSAEGIHRPQVYAHQGLDFLGCGHRSGFDLSPPTQAIVSANEDGTFTVGLDIKVDIDKNQIVKTHDESQPKLRIPKPKIVKTWARTRLKGKYASQDSMPVTLETEGRIVEIKGDAGYFCLTAYPLKEIFCSSMKDRKKYLGKILPPGTYTASVSGNGYVEISINPVSVSRFKEKERKQP